MNISYTFFCLLKNYVASTYLFPICDARQSLFKLFLVIATLAVSCLPFSAFSAEGVIDTGDFETGDFSQWRTLSGHDDDRQFQIVTSPVRQGQYAARLEVRDGDKFMQTSGERANLVDLADSNPKTKYSSNREENGDEYYYAWSTLFSDINPIENWRPAFMQWHTSFGPARSPILFTIDPATMDIYVHLLGGKCSRPHCNDNVRKYKIVDNASRSKWNDFVIHVKWTCGNSGLVEVWHKYANEDSYEKVLSKHNIPTLQHTTYYGGCMGVYKVLGWYRSSVEAGTSVLYYDGFTQGPSFEAVAEHAHNAVTTQNKKLVPPSNLRISAEASSP